MTSARIGGKGKTLIEQVLAARRSRRYSREKFIMAEGSARLLVPVHVPIHLRLYFDYVTRGIVQAIVDHSPKGPDIYLGFAKHSLHVPARAQFILIQHEQTHVSPLGSSDKEELASYQSDPAMEEVIDGVRLHGTPDAFERADHIIDYSIANQNNILGSSLKALYSRKSYYIAPLIGASGVTRIPRKACKVVTMFGQPEQGRRGKILRVLRQSGIEVTNIRNFDDYSAAFEDSAVLVNLAQKSYLQTPEELRILPALLQGLLVITEDNPFLDQLPYRDFVISALVPDLPKTIMEVTDNYRRVWERTFLSDTNFLTGFRGTIRQIEDNNTASFLQMVA